MSDYWNRPARLIASFTPSETNLAAIEEATGQDISGIRLVYTPNNSDYVLEASRRIAQRASSQGKDMPVLVDIEDPHRSVVLQAPTTPLSEGQELSVSSVTAAHPQSDVVFSSLPPILKRGDRIILDFGLTILEVTESKGKSLQAIVTKPGEIKEEADVFFIFVKSQAASVVNYTSAEFEVLRNIQADILIIPGFNRTAALRLLQMKISGIERNRPWVILKVDSRSVFRQLPKLVDLVDGTMVSRKDLSLTTKAATIPMITKEVIKICKESSKLVFVASDMLGSMSKNPTPTRAEVSDIANAVIDGTDGIILADGIANGPHLSRAVSVGNRIVSDIPATTTVNWQRDKKQVLTPFDAVVYHSIESARRLKAKAIVCITRRGNTARRLSRFDVHIPVFAVTFTRHVERKLKLLRGVYPLHLNVAPQLDEVLPIINERLLEEPWLNAGDSVVLVSVSLSPIADEASNLFSVFHLGHA